MPQEAPTKAPTRTTSPTIQPEEDPDYQIDPDKLCPDQRTTITRRILPFLP